MILLRGFSKRPQLPSIAGIYKIKAAAISAFPMYRGLASLVGLDVLDTGSEIEEEFATLEKYYPDYNFFYLHIKQIDTAGEDGDFARKVRLIEQVDAALGQVIYLSPEVIVITGAHSTPAIMALHSCHPVPVLIRSKWCRNEKINKFSEASGLKGSLARFPATYLMPMVMAHA
jgi:2,3-bisphosphoglycerate-independent phosphoglycerate mutase